MRILTLRDPPRPGTISSWRMGPTLGWGGWAARTPLAKYPCQLADKRLKLVGEGIRSGLIHSESEDCHKPGVSGFSHRLYRGRMGGGGRVGLFWRKKGWETGKETRLFQRPIGEAKANFP